MILLFTACDKRYTDTQPDGTDGATGNVVIMLGADTRHESFDVKSSSEEEIPLDEFWVEIFNSKSKRLYCERYAVAKDDVINLNTGDYRLLARYGDSLGVGFDKPFYMADTDFVVEARKDNSVAAVATLANVKARVVFGDNLSNSNFYGDCYAVLKSTDRNVKSMLTFGKDESRAGYIPAGDLILEVYAKIGDEYMYYPLEAKTYSPNDFVTFNVDADVRNGDLTVSLTIDDSVEVLENTIVIPSQDALPVAPPVVSLSGFDSDKAFYLSPGVKPAHLELVADINAPATLSTLSLEIDSECLRQAGVPSMVDLLSSGSDEELEKAGFIWYVNSASTVAVIDFESVAAYLAMNSSGSSSQSSIRITATDIKGRTAWETVNFVIAEGVVARVQIDDYNVWASKIVSPGAVFDSGMPDNSEMQYTANGSKWISVGGPVSVSDGKAVYSTVSGLEPDTQYTFRILSGGQTVSKGEFSVTTEKDLQLPNAGFESWTTEVHHYRTKGLFSDNNEQRDWYRPWGESDIQWWDVNSKKTLVSYTSQQYAEYKVVPTVSYSSDSYEGSTSAQLVSTFVCNMASDADDGIGTAGNLGGAITGMGVEYSKAAGEIFIGLSDDAGDHLSEGRAFDSRPVSLSFRYKYDPYDGDAFKVTVRVEDASGNVIASQEVTDGTSASRWTEKTVNLYYNAVNRKAARIYVCFRSSASDDDDIKYRKAQVTIAGETKNGYIGSVLKIDDLQLNY